MPASQKVRSVAVPVLTGTQLESWRLLWEEFARDADAMAARREWERRRREIGPEVLKLLQRYLSGEIDTGELRATLDLRTKTGWDVFGLRGMSGAMFLNQLVKYMPDPAALSAQLRAVLPAPPDEDLARKRMRAFVRFLQESTNRAGPEASHIQPARAAFLTSICWQLQDTEQWPAFQPSAREALQAEEHLYAPTGEPVDDYFAFRTIFRTLATSLGLTAWQLEYLCWWHQNRNAAEHRETYDPRERDRRRRAARERATKVALVREADLDSSASDAQPDNRTDEAREHTHVQWLLATIGRKLGCEVWIAANDRKRQWEGETLGELSIPKLPSLGLGQASQRVVSLIDVVWLTRAHQVAAAFEVEYTTSVYSGLLRMADLATLAPNLNFPLYIVAPASRLEKVRRELSRPTFRDLDLHRRCAFFSSEALFDAANDIMHWASSAAAIDKLAFRIEDAPGD